MVSPGLYGSNGYCTGGINFDWKLHGEINATPSEAVLSHRFDVLASGNVWDKSDFRNVQVSDRVFSDLRAGYRGDNFRLDAFILTVHCC